MMCPSIFFFFFCSLLYNLDRCIFLQMNNNTVASFPITNHGDANFCMDMRMQFSHVVHSSAARLRVPEAHRRKMWWKQWCHAREEGRGCELSSEREPGRDSTAASLLFARGETDSLKTARGHNGLSGGRTLTHWTFDEHEIQGESV